MNKCVKFFISGLLCFLMSACASISNAPTAAQRTYNQFDTAIVNIGDQNKACTEKFWSTAPHLKKIFIDTDFIPESIKTDKSHIKNADKAKLKNIIDGTDDCISKTVNRLNSYPMYQVNKFGPLVADGWQLDREIRQKFLDGKITVSEAAQSSRNVFQYRDAVWRKTHQNVVAALDQQHFQQLQAEAAMWQAVGDGFQDYSQKQQQYQNAYNQRQQENRPVHTQCSWNAGVMNCTSYQY